MSTVSAGAGVAEGSRCLGQQAADRGLKPVRGWFERVKQQPGADRGRETFVLVDDRLVEGLTGLCLPEQDLGALMLASREIEPSAGGGMDAPPGRRLIAASKLAAPPPGAVSVPT